MATPTPLIRSVGYADSDGERIYYEVTGAGDPVVLCHGLGGNHAIWWRQVEPFAAEHRLVTWDQRGFGNSTVQGGDVSPVAAQRDLGAVIDRLGLDRVSLVGQSMGGWAVLGFALAHPERVTALVLSTTLAGAEKKYVDVLVNAEPDRERFNRREHPVLGAEFCRRHPELGVLYNQIASFGARPDPARVLKGMADTRFDPASVAALDVPTLVVMALDDEHCPRHAMQSVVDSMRSAQLVEVPGGHSAYYEDPERWNTVVLDFLRST
jgi:pimeloyl-ACP methyl ester carboxylesterase